MNLVLPKYGALTLLKPQRKGGDPPPKKTARLDPPASGSASTSTSASLLSGAPIKLSLVNGPISTEPPASYKKSLFGRLANTIRVTLPTDTSGAECMSITEAYHACRTLVRTMDMGEDVYRTLSQQLEQYLSKMLSRLKADCKSQVEWLDLLAEEWRSFENRLKTLQCMLSDIDRVYVANHPNLDTIHDLGLGSFKGVVMEHSITDKVQAGIVEWLNQERLNSRPDHNQRQSVLTLRNCLVSLRLYGKCLEEPYLVATTAYWTDEGAVQRNAEDFSAAAYIETCIKHIKTEEDRARVVLLPGGWEPIVPGLVTLRNFAKEVVKECFGEVNRGEFASALDDAFSAGVGARDYVPSAMMAQALDREMRRGQRGESDQGWKDKLFGILELSKYTRDKDVFREIYTRALAKRLLTQSTTDDDMEKTLIVKLKSDYDPEFSAGDVMFKDLQQSSGDMEEYRRRIQGYAGDLDRSLNVMVLTHAKWPSFKEHNMLASEDTAGTTQKKRGRKQATATTAVELPPEMAAALLRYEKYYTSKHSQRRTAWFHSLGTVVLTSRFPGGNKEISVSMYQALVLLLFNEKERFSAAEIQLRTKLSDEDLLVTLQSLALGKKRVLIRANPKTTKDIAPSDEFKWNGEFTDSKRNFRVQSIQQQTTMEDTQEAEKEIIEGRQHVIDAAIVRIMKAKKTRTYEQVRGWLKIYAVADDHMLAQLKTETIMALEKHFKPSVADIKKRVDELQEKEYIERDPNDKNMFRYVA
ncbi:hypothetical protein FRC06_000983 [Ceratobasidium sp. 370]|nr:hypothetical protein FRC06_000983 [Ceratobasidium sp. 370]